MLVDDNLVPGGPNGQLDPYFIKLIVSISHWVAWDGVQAQHHGQSVPKGWSGKTSPCDQPSCCTVSPIAKYEHGPAPTACST